MQLTIVDAAAAAAAGEGSSAAADVAQVSGSLVLLPAEAAAAASAGALTEGALKLQLLQDMGEWQQPTSGGHNAGSMVICTGSMHCSTKRLVHWHGSLIVRPPYCHFCCMVDCFLCVWVLAPFAPWNTCVAIVLPCSVSAAAALQLPVRSCICA